MDRCHRIGQTKPVHVYRLATAQSVEVEFLELLVCEYLCYVEVVTMFILFWCCLLLGENVLIGSDVKKSF